MLPLFTLFSFFFLYSPLTALFSKFQLCKLAESVFCLAILPWIPAIAFFISCREIFSSRISMRFLFTISISLLHVSFCSCIVFLGMLNRLSVLPCGSLSFFKIAILNSLSGNHRSLCLQVWLLEDYYVLVMSCFLDSSHSSEFCTAVFVFKVAVTSPNLY